MTASTSTKWRPTKNMKAALTYAIAHDWTFFVSHLCAELGFDRSAYYQWFHNEHFRAWWKDRWERYFEVRMNAVWAASAARAEGRKGAEGSTQDAKLLAERFDKGYQPKTRQELSGETTLKTYINVDVPRVAGKETEEPEQEGGDV